MPDGGNQPLPSIDVIRGELNRQQESYERRATQMDTRAGLILAAAGVVVAFRADQPTLFGVLAQAAAAMAGGLAIFAFLPRVAGGLSPLGLRNSYIQQPEEVTKLVVLDTLLTIHADDERQLMDKAKRLKQAVIALGVAVALALLGSIVSYAAGIGGPSEQPRSSNPSPSPSSSLQQPSTGPTVSSRP